VSQFAFHGYCCFQCMHGLGRFAKEQFISQQARPVAGHFRT
jgi:hypothetical protein